MNNEFVEFIKSRDEIKKYNTDGTFNKNIENEYCKSKLELEEKFLGEFKKYNQYIEEFRKFISQFKKIEVLAYFAFLRIFNDKDNNVDESLNIFQLEFLQYILISNDLEGEKKLLSNDILLIKDYLLVIPNLISFSGENKIDNIKVERAMLRDSKIQHLENQRNEQLLKKIDVLSISQYGIKYSLVMKMLIDVLAQIKVKIDNYIKIEDFKDPRQIGKDIYEICSFSIEDFSKIYNENIMPIAIEGVLDKISYSLEEKVDFNGEDAFTNNPVWSKFLIKTDNGKYFFPPIDSFMSRGLDIFKELISEDIKMSEKYNKVKGEFLENQVIEIFKRKYKKFKVYSNWTLKDKNEISFESDVILIYKNYAIVIEAKAKEINKLTYNGVISKFKSDFNKIVRAPRKQVNNIKKILEDNKGKVIKLTKKSDVGKSGKEKANLDLTNVNKIIGFSVSISGMKSLCNSQLSWAYENEKNLKNKINEVDIKKIMPHIQLKHLNIITDLLVLEAEFIHYIKERTRIEQTVMYDGDELDLLGYYLNTSFKKKFSLIKNEKTTYLISGADEELNDYFFKKINRKTFKKNKVFSDGLLKESKKNKNDSKNELLICDIPYKLKNILLEKIEELKNHKYFKEKSYGYMYSGALGNDYLAIVPIVYRSEIESLEIKVCILQDKGIKEIRDEIMNNDLIEFYVVGIKCNRYGGLSFGFVEEIDI